MAQFDGGYGALLRIPFRRRAQARHIIGGNFAAFGAIEAAMLGFYGLPEAGDLIDVGCGAGRLTAALAQSFGGSYLGIDPVPTLLREARRVGKPGWRFERANGWRIPAPDASADMVCFFSVITHLPHEVSYLYLEETRRVLRPGGRVVLSFLEHEFEPHEAIFAASVDGVRHARPGQTQNIFVSREALRMWARRLDLVIVDVRDGNDRFVPLSSPVTLDDGNVMETWGCLGQSVAVLEKPAGAA